MATVQEALADSDVVLLCVADEALVPLTRKLANTPEVFHRQVVLFTSGYLPVARLAPLRRRGCAIGRLHPLAPIPSGTEHKALVRVPFAIEGDARAVGTARRIVRKIKGEPLFMTKRRGAAQAYHAGASLLSGGLVALFHLSERVMSVSVSSRADLRDSLRSFARDTLENAWRLGPKEALTGALSRGSEALVRGHLAALRRVPEARESYRLLGRTMLDLARSRGSIDRGTKERLVHVLSSKRKHRRPRRRPITGTNS